MLVEMTQSRLKLIIAALEFKAHDTAGHSQFPDLLVKDETPEWKPAQVLKKFTAAKRHTRRGE